MGATKKLARPVACTAVVVLVLVSAALSEGYKYEGGTGSSELYRWDIPALKFTGISERHLAPDRPGRTPESKIGVEGANWVRKCFMERHPFKDAARAWDVMTAVAAARSPHAMYIAGRLAERMRMVFLEFWLYLVTNSRKGEGVQHFTEYCRLVFAKEAICAPEVYRSVVEACPEDNYSSTAGIHCDAAMSAVERHIIVDVFANNPKTDSQVAGAVGSDPAVILDTFRNGNTRELLTLAFMKEKKLAPVLVYMVRFPLTPEACEAITRDMDPDPVVCRHIDFAAVEETCQSRGCEPREKNLNRLVYAQTTNYWVYRNNLPGFEREMRPRGGMTAKPVSMEDLEFLSTELSDREKAFLEQTPGYQGDSHHFMPWLTGSQRWMVTPSSDYGRSAYASLLNTVAGPSGTTARTFLTAKFMGFTEKEMLVLRLALVGYLVPWQHSLLEVLLGSAEFVGYTETTPSKVHTSILPGEPFSFSFPYEPYPLTRDSWNDHVKSIAVMMRTKKFPHLERFRSFGVGDRNEELYSHMVYDSGTCSPDDPQLLIHTFHDSYPRSYLDEEYNSATLRRCVFKVIQGPPIEDKQYASINLCREANKKIIDRDDASPWKIEANACPRGCSMYFHHKSHAGRYFRTMDRGAELKRHRLTAFCGPDMSQLPAPLVKAAQITKEEYDGHPYWLVTADIATELEFNYEDANFRSSYPQMESTKNGGYDDLGQMIKYLRPGFKLRETLKRGIAAHKARKEASRGKRDDDNEANLAIGVGEDGLDGRDVRVRMSEYGTQPLPEREDLLGEESTLRPSHARFISAPPVGMDSPLSRHMGKVKND